jgi:hypothetical protein
VLVGGSLVGASDVAGAPAPLDDVAGALPCPLVVAAQPARVMTAAAAIKVRAAARWNVVNTGFASLGRALRPNPADPQGP